MSTPSQKIRDSINVTPLADVMLVLLVLFMVVTPMLKPGMGFPVPGAAHGEAYPHDERTLVLSMQEGGSLYLNRRPIPSDALLPTLAAILRKQDRVVFLEAAERLDYGEVLAVLDACRRAGAREIALVTRERTASF